MSQEYRNPFRDVAGIVSLRVDQGVDFAGSGPIYALGPGVVELVYPLGGDSGWPGPGNGHTGGGYVRYRLTAGPANGKHVFVAENVEPTVQAGQTVDASTVVCRLNNADPNCEVGWASGVGTQTAHRGCGFSWDDTGYTAMGDNFNKLLRALNGPTGLYHPPLVGGLCPGFPETWDFTQPPEPPVSEDMTSLVVADFKHAGTPPGRTRFVRLTIRPKGQPFTLHCFNGAKIAGHGGGDITQASNGQVLGVEPSTDGVHFVVTADDGGTFGYAFTK